MKLLRTVRADSSDLFVFEKAAEPDEWAVSGAFVFACLDPATLTGQTRAAFRAGFLGINSLGWSTLARIVEASESEHADAVELLAKRLVERFGAPDIETAMPAAKEEIAFAASLCDHPEGMLVAVSRHQEHDVTHKAFRTLQANVGPKALRAFSFMEATDEEEIPDEQVDLVALASGDHS
jgi:hypothetical protein